MKRQWLLPLLALSLFINVGVLAGIGFQAWRSGSAAELAFFGMDHERVPDYLKLDGVQRERWHAMENQFVADLNDSGRAIAAHRERLVRAIFAEQPDADLVERERASIFLLQEGQQRSVIAQLLKERELLNPEQRAALAELLLMQGSPATTGAQPSRAR